MQIASKQTLMSLAVAALAGFMDAATCQGRVGNQVLDARQALHRLALDAPEDWIQAHRARLERSRVQSEGDVAGTLHFGAAQAAGCADVLLEGHEVTDARAIACGGVRCGRSSFLGQVAAVPPISSD